MPAAILPAVGIPDFEVGLERRMNVTYAPGPSAVPCHYLRWRYPALGMDAWVVDRSLHEQYQSAPSMEGSRDPVPDFNLLRGRSDLVISPDGSTVFRTMALGVTPIPVSTARTLDFERGEPAERGAPSTR